MARTRGWAGCRRKHAQAKTAHERMSVRIAGQEQDTSSDGVDPLLNCSQTSAVGRPA